MAIKLVKNTPLVLSQRSLIVVPIHTTPHKFSRHPLPDLKYEYTLAWAHMRRYGNKKMLERGKLLLSEGIEDRVICWMPTAPTMNGKHYLSWIKAGLEEMVRMGLHDKYDIAFPAIGIYDEDKTDVIKVYKLIKKYFENTKKRTDFLLDF